MSVLIEAISVVVQRLTLERSYEAGVDGYERDCPNATFCADEHLTRVGFMAPPDVRAYVTALEALFGLVLVNDSGEFQDVAVVDQRIGPTAPCRWLEFAVQPEGRSACWLAGTIPGALAVPKRWTPEDRATFNFTPSEEMSGQLIEQAGNLDQVLDAETGKQRWAGRPFPDLQRAGHLVRQGKQAEETGDDLAAVAFYEEALRLRRDDPTIWFCVAVVRGRLDGPEAAIPYYDEALRLNPSHQQALCNKGVSLNSIGRSEEALSLLRAAIELDPADPVAWWGRATILVGKGHYRGTRGSLSCRTLVLEVPCRGCFKVGRRFRRGTDRVRSRTCRALNSKRDLATPSHSQPRTPRTSVGSPPLGQALSHKLIWRLVAEL